MHFFRDATIPYIDIAVQHFPNIARELGFLGYQTSVIQPVSMGFFNYQNIYKQMGFDQVISLWQQPDVKLDAAGRFPADLELVKEIIKVSQSNDPFFVFAFPNSTHSNWNYSAYDDSDLDVLLDKPLSFPGAMKQLKTYINALNTADQAIEVLIQHFAKVDKKVAILVVGDHQPGLPEFRELYLSNNTNLSLDFNTRKEMKQALKSLKDRAGSEQFQDYYSVPFVLWTNFSNQKPIRSQYGMNSLVLTLFEIIGITPQSPFYNFLKKYSQSVSYQSLIQYKYQETDQMNDDELQWHKDFETIQYDLLYGEGYLEQ